MQLLVPRPGCLALAERSKRQAELRAVPRTYLENMIRENKRNCPFVPPETTSWIDRKKKCPAPKIPPRAWHGLKVPTPRTLVNLLFGGLAWWLGLVVGIGGWDWRLDRKFHANWPCKKKGNPSTHHAVTCNIYRLLRFCQTARHRIRLLLAAGAYKNNCTTA